MNITEINQKKLSSLDTSELKAMHDIFKGVSNPNAKKITKDLEAELKNRKTESYKLKEGRISKICSIVLGENFCPNFIYEDIDFTKPSEIKEAYEIFEASADWIIYDRKTGKQLSPSKSWRKWQGAKMAAAKIGGDAEVSDKAWYHDNKAKLMGEAVAPKKLDTEINTGPFGSKQQNSILSIIKMLPGKITDNSKATDVNGGGQLGVEIDGKVYIWFTMSALGHTGSVELKPASGKKRSTNSKDFKNIAAGPGQKALVAYVKELLSMNEATDKELDVKDLEKMIKNPDPKRVKSYGGTKYVDMLKSKLAKLKESTDLEEASATVQSVLKALRLKGGKDADTLIKKMRDLGLESKVSKAHADAAKKILKGQITKFVKESEDLEEAIKWWTVTITKKAGKLFKGQTVDVKASNSAQAIKKGIKQMKGDPITVPSGSVDAVLGEGTSHNFARKHNT